MSDALREKLLAAFEVEHKDHLESVRHMLDELEASSWAAALDLVELHRRLHSLKGAARAVDLRAVERLAHELESFVEKCQEGNAVIDAKNASVLRQALDTVEDLVAAARNGAAVPDIESLMGDVEALHSGGVAGSCRPSPTPEDEPALSLEDARRISGQMGADESIQTLRVTTESLDSLLRESSELVLAVQYQEQFGERLRQLTVGIEALRERLKGLDSAAAVSKHSDWDGPEENVQQRVGAPLDKLARTLAEIVKDQRTHAWDLHQLEARIESQIGRVRMTPADSVFMDFRKSVRDLARDEGKRVRVDVRGLQTLADRSILQRLREPILHLLRNAVAHGIEAVEERAAAGKSEEARILLDISTAGSRLNIRVEDDGRGIDSKHVAQIAVDRGLRSASEAEDLDPSDLVAVLAEPGLSTSSVVTEVSGRGMGLSIVRRIAHELRGSLGIDSNPGNGTCISLSVPIRVARTSMLVASVEGELFCIPADSVKHLRHVQPSLIDTVDDRAVIPIAGDAPLPVAPLSGLIGRSATLPDPSDSGLYAVAEIHSRAGERLGLVVNGFEGVRDVLVRDIGLTTPIVTGGAILESGRVVSILSTGALFERYTDAAGSLQFGDPERPALARIPTILVVDDSITTRTLEKSVLEANGYRVQLAVNGIDALEQLRSDAVDLIVSDIEMPELDGFGLLAAVKRDKKLASTPLILVTSRNAESDRHRGLELGAEAYVVKQRFDQDELLKTIAQLL